MPRTPINAPGNLLIFDWDGTLSTKDTLSLIAPSPEALKPYTEAYMKDMKRLSDTFGPRDSLERMKDWLDRMQEIEYASVKRVEDGGLFKNASQAELLQRAQDRSKLDLQSGATELLKDFKGHWGIVSVGWSGIFIRSALEARGVDLRKNLVGIAANEVCFDDGGFGTGMISKHESNERGIRTAQDKLREMRLMVQDWRGQTGADGQVIYTGDSETDLLCLLEADTGIIMNSQSMVEKCQKLGITAETLNDLPRAGDERCLWHATDLQLFLSV